VLPKILKKHYKTELSADHLAKFHAGRPMHFEDLALNKKFVAKQKQPKNLGQNLT